MVFILTINIREWERYLKKGTPTQKFDFITKYAGKLENVDTCREFYQEFAIFVQLNPEYGLQDYQGMRLSYLSATAIMRGKPQSRQLNFAAGMTPRTLLKRPRKSFVWRVTK